MAQGPTPLERFIQGILPENPVYRQLLGLCPTLAVTGSMKAAITMSGAVMFVLFCANVITSLIRNLLKPHRLSTQSSLVPVLQPVSPAFHRAALVSAHFHGVGLG